MTITPESLEAEFNEYGDGDGEHPTYDRNKWRAAVKRQGTLFGYWQWVHRELTSRRHVYVCAVRMAFQVDSLGEAEDAVAKMLRTHLHDETCALVDWNYDDWGTPQAVPVADNFDTDSGVPQIPYRDVRAD